MQHFDDRRKKFVILVGSVHIKITDHTEIDISFVVKDRSAAGITSCQNYTVCHRLIHIHFLEDVLISSDYYGILIRPDDEAVVVRRILAQVLFESQVVKHVLIITYQPFHIPAKPFFVSLCCVVLLCLYLYVFISIRLFAIKNVSLFHLQHASLHA